MSRGFIERTEATGRAAAEAAWAAWAALSGGVRVWGYSWKRLGGRARASAGWSAGAGALVYVAGAGAGLGRLAGELLARVVDEGGLAVVVVRGAPVVDAVSAVQNECFVAMAWAPTPEEDAVGSWQYDNYLTWQDEDAGTLPATKSTKQQQPSQPQKGRRPRRQSLDKLHTGKRSHSPAAPERSGLSSLNTPPSEQYVISSALDGSSVDVEEVERAVGDAREDSGNGAGSSGGSDTAMLFLNDQELDDVNAMLSQQEIPSPSLATSFSFGTSERQQTSSFGWDGSTLTDVDFYRNGEDPANTQLTSISETIPESGHWMQVLQQYNKSPPNSSPNEVLEAVSGPLPEPGQWTKTLQEYGRHASGAEPSCSPAASTPNSHSWPSPTPLAETKLNTSTITSEASDPAHWRCSVRGDMQAEVGRSRPAGTVKIKTDHEAQPPQSPAGSMPTGYPMWAARAPPQPLTQLTSPQGVATSPATPQPLQPSLAAATAVQQWQLPESSNASDLTIRAPTVQGYVHPGAGSWYQGGGSTVTQFTAVPSGSLVFSSGAMPSPTIRDAGHSAQTPRSRRQANKRRAEERKARANNNQRHSPHGSACLSSTPVVPVLPPLVPSASSALPYSMPATPAMISPTPSLAEQPTSGQATLSCGPSLDTQQPSSSAPVDTPGGRSEADADMTEAGESDSSSRSKSPTTQGLEAIASVIENMDVETRLSFKESLYRLAHSAKERGGRFGDPASMSIGTFSAAGDDMTELTKRLDRSIANLLYHRAAASKSDQLGANVDEPAGAGSPSPMPSTPAQTRPAPVVDGVVRLQQGSDQTQQQQTNNNTASTSGSGGEGGGGAQEQQQQATNHASAWTQQQQHRSNSANSLLSMSQPPTSKPSADMAMPDCTPG
eukprot:jgi/Chlat1/1067/Chrsp110S01541